MKPKETTRRKPRRSMSEETLRPGEALIVKNGSGNIFELRRVDAGHKSINAGLDRLLAEMPAEGERVRTDLARIIIQDRE